MTQERAILLFPPPLIPLPAYMQRHAILSRAVIRVLNSDIAKITYGEILSGLFLNETRNSMRGQWSKYTPYNGYGYSEEKEDASRRWIYLQADCNEHIFRPDVVTYFLRSEVSSAQAP